MALAEKLRKWEKKGFLPLRSIILGLNMIWRVNSTIFMELLLLKARWVE
jgi:hypothetical protein